MAVKGSSFACLEISILFPSDLIAAEKSGEKIRQPVKML